jgi:hypothetical protein
LAAVLGAGFLIKEAATGLATGLLVTGLIAAGLAAGFAVGLAVGLGAGLGIEGAGFFPATAAGLALVFSCCWVFCINESSQVEKCLVSNFVG